MNLFFVNKNILVDKKFQLIPKKTDAIITLYVLNFCLHKSFICYTENFRYFSIFFLGLRITNTDMKNIHVEMMAIMNIYELIRY